MFCLRKMRVMFFKPFFSSLCPPKPSTRRIPGVAHKQGYSPTVQASLRRWLLSSTPSCCCSGWSFGLARGPSSPWSSVVEQPSQWRACSSQSQSCWWWAWVLHMPLSSSCLWKDWWTTCGWVPTCRRTHSHLHWRCHLGTSPSGALAGKHTRPQPLPHRPINLLHWNCSAQCHSEHESQSASHVWVVAHWHRASCKVFEMFVEKQGVCGELDWLQASSGASVAPSTSWEPSWHWGTVVLHRVDG